MRPKNLKCPFTWKDRRPMIWDHILYVPKYYQHHQDFCFPGWESSEVFGRKAPVEIEYCAGNGAWIVEKALAHPERNWVAVEWQFERVRKIWSKINNFDLKNLFIVCGEAQTFTQFYAPAQSASGMYVNFPDPWPKEKHAKNRLLKEPFLSAMATIAVAGANLMIVTDHALYKQQILKGMGECVSWDPCFQDPFYITDYQEYGTSYFDALWREQGLPVYYMQYRKKV